AARRKPTRLQPDGALRPECLPCGRTGECPGRHGSPPPRSSGKRIPPPAPDSSQSETNPPYGSTQRYHAAPKREAFDETHVVAPPRRVVRRRAPGRLRVARRRSREAARHVVDCVACERREDARRRECAA